MRAVFDTNVLISAVLFGGIPRRLLVWAIQGEIHLVTSSALLDELEHTLSDEKFAYGRLAARATRSEIESLAEVVEPTEVPRVCRDPDDDEVLAAALIGAAEVIATGDADLLDLGSYRGMEIVTPVELAEHHSRGEQSPQG